MVRSLQSSERLGEPNHSEHGEPGGVRCWDSALDRQGTIRRSHMVRSLQPSERLGEPNHGEHGMETEASVRGQHPVPGRWAEIMLSVEGTITCTVRSLQHGWPP